MKTVFSFLAITFLAANGYAQTSSELTCRAKAKEVAAQTYSSCVTEARNAKVEDIRASYQKDLAALKAKYDKELKKVTGKKMTAMAAPTVKELQTTKVTKGIAKTLPTKDVRTEDAAPVQTISEGSKVVAVGTDRAAESVETDAIHAAEQQEITTEVPAE